MNVQLIPSARQKQILSTLKKQFGGLVISQSDLRSDNVITNNANSYLFPLLRDQQAAGAVEKKLDKNDAFFCTHLGIFLSAQVAVSPGKAALQTYPNQQVFPASAGFVPTDLEAFYNAYLGIKVGTKTYVEGFSTKAFRYVPETQKSAATNESQLSQADGYVEWNNLMFSGASDLEIALNLAGAGALEVESVVVGTNHVVSFVAHGFLIKGGARKATGMAL